MATAVGGESFSSGEVSWEQQTGTYPTAQVAAMRFEKQRLLGSGIFGDAWLAKSVASQRQYVIKELKMSRSTTKEDQDQTFNEVGIIKRCCHVNIIRYKEYFIRMTE
jgi:serine/threonine protein kinase